MKKELTWEIAEQFLKNSNSVDLPEFVTISDAAAESLGKLKGWLHLNGLTSLSDAAAESLAKHKGFFYLNGLTSLSDAAAESLGKHEYTLYLNGLTSLSDAAAEVGFCGSWWISEASTKKSAFFWSLYSLNGSIGRNDRNMSDGLSVRCLRD